MTAVRAALSLLALLLGAAAGAAGRAEPVAVKIAAINDFHGNLEIPAEGLAGRRAGGIAHLAAVVGRLRAQSPHFAFVSAGDLVGASPLLSAYFDDEPTVEAMNLAGLDFNGVGNHEFDRGIAHLQRLQDGGCPPDGCVSGTTFSGSRFRMLAANVIVRKTGKPLFPPYGFKDYGSVKVAFVGLTLRETALISSPRSIEEVEFRDEADTVNALVPEMKRQGAGAIVVLIHQGGETSGTYQECANLRGPIVDIARRMDPAVNVIVSAHSHQAYICELDGKLVTSAGSYGRFVTEIDLRIDPAGRELVSASARNLVVQADAAADGAQLALIERYSKLAAPLRRVVGRVAGAVSRRPNADGESAMGRLIADAHLAAAAGAGAMLAFMNPGGIRSSFVEGEVTYFDLFSVYPFANTLVTMTLTGAQILRLLEQQWRGGETRMLQVSRGFAYTWDAQRPAGARVAPESVTLNGRPLRADASYRVTVNSFMAEGGDGFGVLREGRERSAGTNARDALAHYLEQRSPLAVAQERRVRRAGSAQ